MNYSILQFRKWQDFLELIMISTLNGGPQKIVGHVVNAKCYVFRRGAKLVVPLETALFC